MSPPWQCAAALHLQTCHCAVGNLSLGVPPKCPQGHRAKRAVTRQRDEAQPWWDTVGSASQGCRAGSRQSFPRVSRAEEVSQAPECTGRLQMAFAEPAASCSQPRRIRCGRRLATAPGVGKAPKQPKRDPSAWPCPLSDAHAGVLGQAPAWAREREEGRDASGTGWVFSCIPARPLCFLPQTPCQSGPNTTGFLGRSAAPGLRRLVLGAGGRRWRCCCVSSCFFNRALRFLPVFLFPPISSSWC